MKIGIMGGTFNPIHNGHLVLAECAFTEYRLDEIWFMPNGIPPHKKAPDMEDNLKHRVNMTKLAIEDHPYFKLCLYEVNKEGLSYTYLTVTDFREMYPEDEFYFIIGGDSLITFDSWVHPEIILEKVHILATYRDDLDTDEEVLTYANRLNEKYHSDIQILHTPIVPVSSTQIRNMIKEGSSDDLLVPEKVKAYILEHHLYQE